MPKPLSVHAVLVPSEALQQWVRHCMASDLKLLFRGPGPRPLVRFYFAPVDLLEVRRIAAKLNLDMEDFEIDSHIVRMMRDYNAPANFELFQSLGLASIGSPEHLTKVLVQLAIEKKLPL